ncbi:MAG: type IV pilus biogenesis/stability protein PilW [Gammaproteobacteria bacterium]
MNLFFRYGLVMMLSIVLGSCAMAPTQSSKASKAAEINTALGIEYLKKDMLDSSMSKLKKAVSQNSRYAPAHEAMAILYEKLGETEKADSHYRRSLSIESKNSTTLNNYGQFLCRQNKLNKADKYFSQALEDPLYPHPELVYSNAGICAAQIPDDRKAEEYFRQALKIRSEYLPALKAMAKLHYAQHNYLGARAYIQRFEARSPLTADLLLLAVQTETKLGDTSATKQYRIDLKKRYPGSSQAQSLLR